MNLSAELIVQNVVVAGVLAMAAALLARFGRRPAIVHVLCVLALLKLVTPPVLPVAVLPPERQRAAAAATTVIVLPTTRHVPARDIAAASPSRPPAVEPWSWLIALWVTGSTLMVGLALRRSVLFKRLLCRAHPAPAALTGEVRRLAARIGLRRPPTIAMLDARLSPSICGLGSRTVLVLPKRLVDDLRPAERRAILVHELAHLRRGDHRIRALELVVATVWWWLPLCWWLSRSLRRAEEQCCDAWVVWALPERERAYADALLSTMDFLAEDRLALPPCASGLGPVHDLKRRLTLIMEARTPKALGGYSRLLVIALTAMLPLAATRAQDERPPQARSNRALLERIEALEQTVEDLQERTRPAQEPVTRDELVVTSTTYVVRSGDTLAKIAKRLQGEGIMITPEQIAAYNTIIPERLRVGQQLVVPIGDPETTLQRALTYLARVQATSRPESVHSGAAVGDSRDQRIVSLRDRLDRLRKETAAVEDELARLEAGERDAKASRSRDR